MTDHEDDVLNQAIDELKALPALDRRRVSEVASAAVAARAAGIDETTAPYLPRVRPAFWRVSTMIGLAAAAGITGFVVRGMMVGSPPLVRVQPNAADSRLTTTVRSVSPELGPVPTQFVYANPRAREVHIIGDFNGWGATSSPMVRGPGGVWSVIQPIVPGRHLYVFVVDDSVMLDPRAASAHDPDYGAPRSVIIVGKP